MRAWYEIDVGDGLDAAWSTWFDGFRVAPLADGVTRLTGPLRDEAALHGLLNKVRDLGLKLISVRRIGPPDEAEERRRNGRWPTPSGPA
jgi:hypothetical protein